MNTKFLFSTLVLFALLASCNMPAAQSPVTQAPEDKPVSLDANAIATALELTAIARVTQIAGSVTPVAQTFPATATATATPTIPVVPGPCSPLVTANVVANVRSGPDTAYDIVGSLAMGQTATIVGRNDAYTWWYIDYPAVAGGHAWIAGSVVTSSSVPAVVQVVAAPLLPTPTIVEASGDDSQSDNTLGLQPDLKVTQMDLSTTAPLAGVTVTVLVKIKNLGNTTASNFTVQWWAGAQVVCSWPVDAVAAGGTKSFSCTYKFPNSGDYTIKAVVDSGDTVSESNENNNTAQKTVKVAKLLRPIITKKLPPIWP